MRWFEPSRPDHKIMLTAKELEEIDPELEKNYRNSRPTVIRAAQWIRETKGYEVHVRPQKLRPNADERFEYRDEGDLIVIVKSVSLRWEVKRRNMYFSNASNYRYRTMMVDVCHSWDSAEQKAFLYLIFDNNMEHVAIVRGSTYGVWTKELKRSWGRMRWHYMSPLATIQWRDTGIVGFIPNRDDIS